MSDVATPTLPDEVPAEPSRDDPLVRGLSVQIGGPLGRHAGSSRRWWTPLRIAIVVALVAIALGWHIKAPCNNNANWANGKQYTTFCYSDVLAVGSSSGVIAGKRPYKDASVEYPVIIGGLMWFAASVGNIGHPANNQSLYFDVTAVVLGISLLIVVLTTALVAGRTRRWDVLMVAAAPVWLLHAFTNWDLVAAAFLALAMLMWAREHPWWAGIFVGLGTATKLYPALLLLVLFPLAWRTGKWRGLAATAGASIITWALVTGPVYLWAPQGVARFFVLNKSRAADWDSVWLLVNTYTGLSFTTTQLNLFSALLFTSVVAFVVMLAFITKKRPRLPALLLVLVVGFLLVNKVHSPQYSVWLVPLVVLAYPRWATFLLWQLSEVLLTILRYLYFLRSSYPTRGVPFAGFEAAVAFRDIMLIVIVALVIRGMFNPQHDPVRATGVDDPAGGVFDGAIDMDDLRNAERESHEPVMAA